MWVTLPPDWKLQDVQAALNVIIAFLCAGCVFVLVRTFWLLAARKVTKQKDIPAHALLSLNTIGEAIDVVWLLRHELLTVRYRGLLVQCIAVLFLTLCTFGSGWIARFSTKGVPNVIPMLVPGSLAVRNTSSLLYDSLDISATYYALEKANFSYTTLAEFWPDPSSNWRYNEQQWMNGSWSMTCTYNESVSLPGARTVATNCSDSTTGQCPWLLDFWWDWDLENSAWADFSDDGVFFPETNDTFKDILYFMHGAEIPTLAVKDGLNLTRYMRVRTIAVHMHGVLRNALYNSSDHDSCQMLEGPIEQASYTSATCELTRDYGTRSGTDLEVWGASADYGDDYELYRVARYVVAVSWFELVV